MPDQDRAAARYRKPHLVERQPEGSLHAGVVFFLLGLVNDRDYQLVDVDLQLVERLQRRRMVGLLGQIEQTLQQAQSSDAAATAEIAGHGSDRRSEDRKDQQAVEDVV